jgi:hypothetical protein
VSLRVLCGSAVFCPVYETAQGKLVKVPIEIIVVELA